MNKKVLVAIADGTEEIEAVTVIDILRRAGADVTVASVGGMQITASRGVKIVADKLIDQCKDETFKAVVLPGGMPGAEHLRDSKPLIDIVKSQKASGKLYAAICASPAVVLAYHGLIDDKKATCYPSVSDKLPNYSGESVVVDGNCITSQGPATAMEFAIALVENLYGKQKASEVSAALLYARR